MGRVDDIETGFDAAFDAGSERGTDGTAEGIRSSKSKLVIAANFAPFTLKILPVANFTLSRTEHLIIDIE